jgi:hypothetical protein
MTKNNDKFDCQFGTVQDKYLKEFILILHTDSSFVDEFKRLDAILKRFDKDHSNRPYYKCKIINLNRQTFTALQRLIRI